MIWYDTYVVSGSGTRRGRADGSDVKAMVGLGDSVTGATGAKVCICGTPELGIDRGNAVGIDVKG